MDILVKSKEKTNIPKGIYIGVIGGWNLKILSQDQYGKNIKLEKGIKGIGVPVIVYIKEGFAYCFDKGIKLNR